MKFTRQQSRSKPLTCPHSLVASNDSSVAHRRPPVETVSQTVDLHLVPSSERAQTNSSCILPVELNPRVPAQKRSRLQKQEQEHEKQTHRPHSNTDPTSGAEERRKFDASFSKAISIGGRVSEAKPLGLKKLCFDGPKEPLDHLPKDFGLQTQVNHSFDGSKIPPNTSCQGLGSFRFRRSFKPHTVHHVVRGSTGSLVKRDKP